MGCVIAKGRKTVRRPVGCEGYLTRHEAAIRLGLPSEFKIRQFEREGRLHAVRGRMGTAFYPEAEVLTLRAELGAAPRSMPGHWSDADLIALLRKPTPSGRLRTAVDLVTDAKINIARAERVYRFWCNSDATLAARVTRAACFPTHATTATTPTSPPVARQPPESRAKSAGFAGREASREAERASASAASRVETLPGFPYQTDVLPPGVPVATDVSYDKSSVSERRGAARLAHDGLIRSLRDPDPRVRARAFSKLKEGAPP